MARVTHIKHARQRYAMVPVVDEATGRPKVSPVYRVAPVLDEEGNVVTPGVPKKTKTGREVTMKVTVQDRTKPLPNLRCDFPGCDVDGGEILPGTPYKHITPRSGPYGGTQRNRHAAHPSWNVWEYSYSVGAQAARLQSEMHEALDSWKPESEDDFDDMRDELSSMAEDFVGEREEALDNMPEQLQDGSQAQEYMEAAESWRDEIANADAPDADDTCTECEGGTVTEPGLFYVVNVDGSGDVFEEGFETEDDAQQALDQYVASSGDDADQFEVEERDDEADCEECGGTGTVEGVSEDWIEEARGVLSDAIDACEL